MTMRDAGSVTGALARSLMLGLTALWLAGVVGSGFVLKRLIDEKSDDELQESAAILMSMVEYADDVLVAAAVVGQAKVPQGEAPVHERVVYQVRDATGRLLVHSANASPELAEVPLRVGFADVGRWRVVTLANDAASRFVQLADPVSERREALARALAWLTLPLAAVLAFAVYIVLRASHSLGHRVRRTALAVSRQDPQALELVPLDGVVTEMRPAIEATNSLLARLADAFEAERSFTYNSAHELRTPIAAALAQAQLLATVIEDRALKARADIVVDALARIARLAERLLALARAEGTQPLAHEWVDLATVVRLTVDEFARHPALKDRRIVAQCSALQVRGDFDAVGLAVRNLVENALVHGADGTLIRVECRREGSSVVLAVIDDGPGVSANLIPSLVKRFVRAPGAAGDGAGLGLSIVETLARRMGAKLLLESPLEGRRGGFAAHLVWPAGPDTENKRRRTAEA